MTDTVSDRRRFQRIAFDAPALITQGNNSWSVKLHDISFKGLLTQRPTNWTSELNQPYLVKVELDNLIKVVMQVQLAHLGEQLLGFICEHIDLDSMSHLRRLVELNLGSEPLLERELAALYQDSNICGIPPRQEAGGT